MTTSRLRQAAIFFVFAFAIASPFSTAAGSVTGVAVLVVGLVALALHAPARAALPRWVLIGLGGMVVWSAIAAAEASPYPTKWEPWYEELWIKIMMLAATGLMAFSRVRVRNVLTAYLIAGAVVAVFGIWQYATGSIPFNNDTPPQRGDRWEIEAYYDHHLTYGGHVMILWLVALARWIFAPPRGRMRGVMAVVVVLLSLGLYWSYARSPQLGAVVGLGVLVLLVPGRRRWILAGLAVLVVAGGLLEPTTRERYSKVLDVSTEQTRLLLWRSSLDGIADRPLTGFGPGNFHEMMADHEVPGDYNTQAHAHNDSIMHAVNGGLPMLGFSLVLAVAIAAFLLRHVRGPDGSVDAIVAGALAAHVALFAAGFVQVFQSDDEVEWTLYFLVACAFAHVARRDQSVSASGTEVV